ncbi:MAG: hypothetical protein WC979_10270 [Candidatus Pacearchaeota archaeon]|jgi:hypothetical protein
MQIKNLREYGLNLKEAQEFCVLSEQLDPADMYVIGFLKNINRNAMRRMSRAGLFDVNYN